jgi:hypothetical protein
LVGRALFGITRFYALRHDSVANDSSRMGNATCAVYTEHAAARLPEFPDDPYSCTKVSTRAACSGGRTVSVDQPMRHSSAAPHTRP